MFLLYAFGASCVAYYFLQQLDDKKQDSRMEPRSSIGKRIMLWFFLFMVFCILFYFVGNGLPSFGSTSEGGADVEMERPVLENMLKKIPDEMQTGLPPFKSMSFGVKEV